MICVPIVTELGGVGEIFAYFYPNSDLIFVYIYTWFFGSLVLRKLTSPLVLVQLTDAK